MLYGFAICPCRLAATILFQITVSKKYILFGNYKRHQRFEDFFALTVRIQGVKSFLQIIIFRVSEFLLFRFSVCYHSRFSPLVRKFGLS